LFTFCARSESTSETVISSRDRFPSSSRSRNGRTELQQHLTVAGERLRSSSINLLNSANIWSQIVTGLGAVWRRLRKVSHSAAVAMKYSCDRLACELCGEGQL